MKADTSIESHSFIFLHINAQHLYPTVASMVGAKLARLKLLMGEEEFERLSRERFPVPEAPKLPVDQSPVIRTLGCQHLSSTHENLPNIASEPVLSASEDDWSRPLPISTKSRKEKTMNQLHFADVAEPDPEGRLLGQLASFGQTFCPILAVSKYPYRYLYTSSATADLVSQNFFAAGKFWARKWTM